MTTETRQRYFVQGGRLYTPRGDGYVAIEESHLVANYLLDEVTSLESALKEYGNHRGDCNWAEVNGVEVWPCKCGWLDILKRLEA